MSAKQYQSLHAKTRGSVVERRTGKESDRAIRGHLRAMGTYYDIPREKTDQYIKALNYSINLSIADELACYADTVGIAKGPASFYIAQQQLSKII